MKTKAAVPCQGDACNRDAVSTHVIHYRGLRFTLPLCEEHGTALKAAEGTEAALLPSPASEEVIRITQGQETIAQICYAHGRPAITIAFPEEIPMAGLQEENEPASVLLPTV